MWSSQSDHKSSRSLQSPPRIDVGRRDGRTTDELACTPGSVKRAEARVAVIHLGLPSPAGSSGLPADSGEQPSNVCAGHDRSRDPLDLAPGGVYQAAPVTRGAGGLLPHRFTLTAPAAETSVAAVCFLWHFPAGHPGLPLTTTLLCGARTFLGSGFPPTRPPSQLVRRACQPTSTPGHHEADETNAAPRAP